MDMSKIASKLKMPGKREDKSRSVDSELDEMYGDKSDDSLPNDPTKVTLAQASIEELQAALDKAKAELGDGSEDDELNDGLDSGTASDDSYV